MKMNFPELYFPDFDSRFHLGLRLNLFREIRLGVYVTNI